MGDVQHNPGSTPPQGRSWAFRIAVNDELAALHGLMDDIVHGAEQADQGGWLNPGARIGMIAFHSLEGPPSQACL